MTIARFIVPVVTLLATVSAVAGPFGLDQGTPISSLNILRRDNGSFTIAVPTPNSSFETYLALATPQDGLCKIVAIGKSFENDAYGSQVQQKYEALSSSLTEKYGSSKRLDFLRSGSIWNEPKDWSMAVKKNERTLETYWDREEHSNIPADIGSIALKAKVVGSDTTYVTLSYEFANFDKCRVRLNATDDKAL